MRPGFFMTISCAMFEFYNFLEKIQGLFRFTFDGKR